MTVRTERRIQSRKRPLSLVYVELPPANGGMMRDLSETGFALRAMMPLRQSEKVPFSFSLDASARIDGDAIVVWVEDDGHVAALEFAGLPAHSRDQIRRWLEKFDEPIAKEAAPAKPVAQDNASFDELRSEIRATTPRPLPAAEHESAGPPPAVESPPVPSSAAALRPAPPAQERVPRARKWKLDAVRPNASAEDAPKGVSSFPERQEADPPARSIAPPSLAVSLPPEKPAAQAPAPAAEQQPPAAPALEPLSPWEGEADEQVPGWMERFTLTRAIGIMLVLTLFAGLFVYHRELGHALIWLGQKIAGEEPTENSKASQMPRSQQPTQTPAASAEPQSGQPADAREETLSKPDAAPVTSNEPKSEDIPATSENTPAPQLKNSTPGALVPLMQMNRTPAAPVPADASGEAGLQEYQQAEQILRTPEREAEVPEAVKLLWSAVEKGHVGAEIALADLFRQGRGVARNCDQAKILLSAAARKGSADAQKRLAELERQGCGE